MLLDYSSAAMDRATYRILSEHEGFYGEIPELHGVWASASTLEECRRELQEVVESWIMVKLRHGDSDFPTLDGVDLNQARMDDTPMNEAVV